MRKDVVICKLKEISDKSKRFYLEFGLFCFGFLLTDAVRLLIFPYYFYPFLPWWICFVGSFLSIFIAYQIINLAMTGNLQIHPRNWVIINSSTCVKIHDLYFKNVENYLGYSQYNDHLLKWCRDNCRSNWMKGHGCFYFNRKSDASMFILFNS